jgi:uncharacterized membrane protein YfcA
VLSNVPYSQLDLGGVPPCSQAAHPHIKNYITPVKKGNPAYVEKGQFMTVPTASSITTLVFATAILYASIGHAGASGYLAAMAIFGVAPEVMRPTALMLNIIVAIIATLKFYRAGHFSWSLFWPFALTSVPFAYIGGYFSLPGFVYKLIVGLILCYAGLRLFISSQAHSSGDTRPLPRGIALLSGAVIGLVSGLTGVGGGIFLSPLLLFTHWASPKQTSAVSAVFILVNSIAGLLGQGSLIPALSTAIPIWGVAVAAGGWIGAEYGSQRMDNRIIRRALAVVLVIAAMKMIFF